MLKRAFGGFVALGGALITAVLLYWIMIPTLGLDDRHVFQGVTISAALIGVVYLAGFIPEHR